MTPSQIIEYARGKTGATVDEINDTNAFLYLNYRYKKVWDKITKADRNYGLKKRTTNIVQGVNEYDFAPVVQSPAQSFGQKTVKKVLVKYNVGDVYGREAKQIDWNNIELDPKYIEDNASTRKPYYIIDQKRIVLYPMPKISVGNGLTIYAGQEPYNLSSAMNANNILVDEDYHDVIALGVVVDFYEYRQRYDLSQIAEAAYEKSIANMIREIKIRSLKPMEGYNDDFSVYLR